MAIALAAVLLVSLFSGASQLSLVHVAEFACGTLAAGVSLYGFSTLDLGVAGGGLTISVPRSFEVGFLFAPVAAAMVVTWVGCAAGAAGGLVGLAAFALSVACAFAGEVAGTLSAVGGGDHGLMLVWRAMWTGFGATVGFSLLAQ